MKTIKLIQNTCTALIFMFLLIFTENSISAQNNCQGKTLTIGGWGAANTSNPNVSYLYANFNNAFPNGVVVGCVGGNTLSLTSPQAITDFLPSGGTASALNATYLNPGGEYNNVLAGQLVAVMLAVGFDNYDEGFSSATADLGSFVFVSGPFQGMTVSQFLSLANNFMGGCGASQYSAAQFNEAATAINQNYDEGNGDLGYLSCCSLKIHVSYDPIKCHGGTTTVNVTATGGSANVQGVGDFVVGAGTHNFTITDGNCSDSVSLVIGEPSLLTVNISNTPILCHGGMSTLTANASGGTGSYGYLWSNGETTQSIQISAGTYSVTVTDQNSCTASASFTATEPDALALTINKGDVLCVGGTASVSANVTGGTPPYSYLWSNGATTQTVNLPVGNFSVTVTDANGCAISQSFEVKLLTCNGFTTVTQGGWGAKAAGNNWGTYRDLNFASAFPSGLTIGADSRFLKLTTAKAVDDFLPSATTPRALNAGTMVNPGSGYKNVLAGQVVALTLNLRFDEVNPSFSSSSTWLGNLIVISGTFTGWTVSQVLAEANNVLGGVASSYSADQMNEIVDAINNNYDNGTVNLGLLGCPCSSTVKLLEKNAIGDGEVIIKNQITSANDDSKVYPNPTRGDINLSFENADGGNVSAYLFNPNGRMTADLSKNVSRQGNRVTISYQNYGLLEGVYILTVKATKFEKSYKIIIRK